MTGTDAYEKLYLAVVMEPLEGMPVSVCLPCPSALSACLYMHQLCTLPLPLFSLFTHAPLSVCLSLVDWCTYSHREGLAMRYEHPVHPFLIIQFTRKD